MITKETENCRVTYQITEQTSTQILERLLLYFFEHEAFHPEVIGQNDNTIIDAPQVMGEICELIDFKVENK